MSTAVASLEHPPSKPEINPYTLAVAAQKAIKEHQDKAGDEAGLIRQLLIGRYVRVKETEVIWLVKEVRMSLGWRAMLWGITRGQKVKRPIGALHDVEVVDLGGSK